MFTLINSFQDYYNWVMLRQDI